jgi:hypothetical protein
MQDSETLWQQVSRVCASFLVPQGYPASVSAQYSEYMSWRGMQYFFGGALSVYTTKALLSSVGLRRGAGASAAAINWVVKDGAGMLLPEVPHLKLSSASKLAMQEMLHSV